jgi:hypothetical protein
MFMPPQRRRDLLKALIEADSAEVTDHALHKLWIGTLMSRSCVSFALPPDGRSMRADQKSTVRVGDCHLPFGQCLLEYECTREFFREAPADRLIPTSSIIHVTNRTARGLLGFQIMYANKYARLSDDLGPSCAMNPLCIYLAPDCVVEIRPDDIVQTINQRAMVLQRDGSFSADADVIETLAYESSWEVAVSAMFLALASCNNVPARKIFEPPAAHLKACAARSRPPMNSYWILDTDFSAPIAGRAESTGLHHAPPRLHIRRGHIRRLGSGATTWVRQCKVGRAELGTIEKIYRVKEGP